MKKLLVTLSASLALALAACATHDKFQENRALMDAGNTEEGLARIEQQVKENPNNVELRNYYLRNKAVVVQGFLTQGDNALGAGQFNAANAAYGKALRYDA